MKKRYTVLHIDDEQIPLEFSKKALDFDDLNLYTTTDTREGEIIFKEKKPDIVILDISMPKKDGLQLAREFKSLNKELKIIIMSSHDDTNRLLDAIDIRVDKYLIKPVKIDTIKEAILELSSELKNKTLTSNLIFIKYGYIWDKDNKKLLKDNNEIKLTPKELAFISLLAKNPSKIYSNEDILKSIWKDSVLEEQKTGKIRGLIDRLKNKLGGSKIFQSNYGRGYKLKLER